MKNKITTAAQTDKSCQAYADEVHRAKRLKALIAELNELLPEFKPALKREASDITTDIGNLIESATDELFYHKQCPFVNACLGNMKVSLDLRSDKFQRMTKGQFLAVIEEFIQSKNIIV